MRKKRERQKRIKRGMKKFRGRRVVEGVERRRGGEKGLAQE